MRVSTFATGFAQQLTALAQQGIQVSPTGVPVVTPHQPPMPILPSAEFSGGQPGVAKATGTAQGFRFPRMPILDASRAVLTERGSECDDPDFTPATLDLADASDANVSGNAPRPEPISFLKKKGSSAQLYGKLTLADGVLHVSREGQTAAVAQVVHELDGMYCQISDGSMHLYTRGRIRIHDGRVWVEGKNGGEFNPLEDVLKEIYGKIPSYNDNSLRVTFTPLDLKADFSSYPDGPELDDIDPADLIKERIRLESVSELKARAFNLIGPDSEDNRSRDINAILALGDVLTKDYVLRPPLDDVSIASDIAQFAGNSSDFIILIRLLHTTRGVMSQAAADRLERAMSARYRNEFRSAFRLLTDIPATTEMYSAVTSPIKELDFFFYHYGAWTTEEERQETETAFAKITTEAKKAVASFFAGATGDDILNHDFLRYAANDMVEGYESFAEFWLYQLILDYGDAENLLNPEQKSALVAKRDEWLKQLIAVDVDDFYSILRGEKQYRHNSQTVAKAFTKVFAFMKYATVQPDAELMRLMQARAQAVYNTAFTRFHGERFMVKELLLIQHNIGNVYLSTFTMEDDFRMMQNLGVTPSAEAQRLMAWGIGIRAKFKDAGVRVYEEILEINALLEQAKTYATPGET